MNSADHHYNDAVVNKVEKSNSDKLDYKKFRISIGNHKWIIKGTATVAILGALRETVAINRKKKIKERKRIIQER